jgi:hypothetical protein
MTGGLRGSQFTGAMHLAGIPRAAFPAPTADPPGSPWTAADLDGIPSVGLEGHRNNQAGLTSLRKLRGDCHKLGKRGACTATHIPRQAPTCPAVELPGHLSSSTQHRHHKAPKGRLLDSLTQAGVLDLLGFVLSGVDRQNPFIFNP